MVAPAWFQRILHSHPRPPKRWPVLQVEVTSRCMLHCGFCPNRALGDQWLRGDLPWDVYRDWLGPHLSRFETVYLQGWGEPMLHPRLWDMIELAKAAGARVGFTTCGGLLSEEAAARVLDLGVDILSISFAGATATTHEQLRRGSHFDQLAANVAGLRRMRGPGGPASPFVELHFLMLRENIAELPEFVRLAARLGADEVVATNLTYTPTSEIAERAVFSPAPAGAHLEAVATATAEAARLDVRFRAYPLVPSEQAMLECDARPTETCFVTFSGRVAPCVYLGLPAADEIPRIYEGASAPTPPVIFGDVRSGLLETLSGPARAAFCAPFRARKRAGAFAVALLDDSELTLPAPNKACLTCYKLWGL
jgi:MoaA/NifB/PqqE/SkfB family radical SAM enzyme